jgi:YbgC/YbaW family acyl-CoA thioester hydrolase
MAACRLVKTMPNSLRVKLYSTPIEVRGYELDSFGHVNHSVYLNYLEFARWQMLKKEGINLEVIEREKRWPVIAGIEIRYLKPAFMGELLEVRTGVLHHGKARFTLEQNIFRAELLITSAKVESVIVNEEGRPVPVPENYTQLWMENG